MKPGQTIRPFASITRAAPGEGCRDVEIRVIFPPPTSTDPQNQLFPVPSRIRALEMIRSVCEIPDRAIREKISEIVNSFMVFKVGKITQPM